jgi:hypothetical protein
VVHGGKLHLDSSRTYLISLFSDRRFKGLRARQRAGAGPVAAGIPRLAARRLDGHVQHRCVHAGAAFPAVHHALLTCLQGLFRERRARAEMDWPTTGLGRPRRIRAQGTCGVRAPGDRPHQQDDHLLGRARCRQGPSAQSTVRQGGLYLCAPWPRQPVSWTDRNAGGFGIGTSLTNDFMKVSEPETKSEDCRTALPWPH